MFKLKYLTLGINYKIYKTTGANHTSYCLCGKQGTTGKHVINNITGRCVVCNMEILVVSKITPPVITPDINY